ncbi:unnamed protein product, partial [Trypanosoma congolense IL3000]
MKGREMKILMVLVVMGIMSRCVAYSNVHNHNGKEHDALCSVLGAVVTLYRSARGGPTLQKALRRALFGNENGDGDLNTLLADLPSTHHNPGHRERSCGDCRYGGGEDYPGWSIPHDLLCLCTVGKNGYPFTNDGQNSKMFCGQSAQNLGCGNGNGCHNGNE